MSASTSGLDLDAIRARVAEATPGPWEWHGHPFQDITGSGLQTFYSVWVSNRPQLAVKGDAVEPLIGNRGTMIFVAAAITDVPALCDEVERLLKEVDRNRQGWGEVVDRLGLAEEDKARLEKENAQLRATLAADQAHLAETLTKLDELRMVEPYGEVERLRTALAEMERTNQQLAAIVQAKSAELVQPDAAGPRPGELGCPCGHPERLHSYSEDGRKVCRSVGCGCGWNFATRPA